MEATHTTKAKEKKTDQRSTKSSPPSISPQEEINGAPAGIPLFLQGAANSAAAGSGLVQQQQELGEGEEQRGNEQEKKGNIPDQIQTKMESAFGADVIA